jgi:hypothetical protein
MTGKDEIIGTVSDGTWTAQILANRAGFSKSHPAPAVGSYTLVIPADVSSTTGPGGNGIGTVIVDSAGGVTWKGSLADGSAVNQKSTISKAGIWPLYSSLYGGAGSVLSWMKFDTATSSASGKLLWLKPQGAAQKTYSGSFTNEVNATGALYNKANSSIGPFSHLVLDGGGLASGITNGISLGANHKVLATGGTKVTLGSGGIFTGKTIDPQSGKTLSFQGVLFNHEQTGFGYFLNAGQSGGVYLTP